MTQVDPRSPGEAAPAGETVPAEETVSTSAGTVPTHDSVPTGVVARVPPTMTVTPLPAPPPVRLGRRAAELVRVGIRHPAVVLSAGAALTLVAEMGLRLLDQPRGGGALSRRTRAANDRSLIVSETWTVTRRIEITPPK